ARHGPARSARCALTSRSAFRHAARGSSSHDVKQPGRSELTRSRMESIACHSSFPSSPFLFSSLFLSLALLLFGTPKSPFAGLLFALPDEGMAERRRRPGAANAWQGMPYARPARACDRHAGAVLSTPDVLKSTQAVRSENASPLGAPPWRFCGPGLCS